MLHHQTPTFQVTTEGITLLEADQVVPPSMKAEGALDEEARPRQPSHCQAQ